MANLKEIRGRIRSVRSTQQMTRAMKMVAAAKLRRAQDKIIALRPYANKLQEIMNDIFAGLKEDFSSPYGETREPEKVLIVLVTSNRGLCGAFNMNIIRYAAQAIQQDYAEQQAKGNLYVYAIGKKGYEFMKRRGFQLVDANHDPFGDLTFEEIGGYAEEIMKGFIDKKWDKVEIFYNEFKNVIVQNRMREQFLPLSGGSEPAQAANAADEAPHVHADYIFEPGKEEILEELIPKSLKLQMFKAVLDSNAAEQGARMTAMDNATENAEELLSQLRLTYNRARQASITTEILEIVGGANALEEGGR